MVSWALKVVGIPNRAHWHICSEPEANSRPPDKIAAKCDRSIETSYLLRDLGSSAPPPGVLSLRRTLPAVVTGPADDELPLSASERQSGWFEERSTKEVWAGRLPGGSSRGRFSGTSITFHTCGLHLWCFRFTGVTTY